MLRRALRIFNATVTSGPRAVLLTRGAKKRGAMQKVREFAALTAFLRTRRLATVVEIGTLHGGTLWAWCRLADSDALVVSIDLPEGTFGGGYDESEADKLRSYAGPDQRVVLLRVDSHASSTVASLERILDGQRIDLLFIDGDHSYSGVNSDFEMYRHLVGDEGLVVFHDILPHPGVPECEVHVLWEQLRKTYDHLELIDHSELKSFGAWGGLGVLFGGARTESGTRAGASRITQTGDVQRHRYAR